MHVNRAVIDRLVANGVDTVFGIPGKQSLPLNEAIGSREDIDFVVARHETAVSHQAWGYAETSDDMAATVVIPGPGDMNAMNGLKNARNDCTPLLHIAIETDPELRGGDAIHETPPDTYDNVVKENILVETPESTAAEIDRAAEVARTEPKGPVRVGIPKNFLEMDVSLAERGASPADDRLAPNSETVSRAVDVLESAGAPVIYAGGGVRGADASEELRAVAERLDAPVVTSYKGKGVIPADHELFAGCLSGSASPELLSCLAESDVALGVGTDFDAVATRGFSVDFPDQLVHVTLDANDIGTAYDPTVGVVADAKLTLAALDEALADRGLDSSGQEGADRARYVRERTAERVSELVEARDPLTSVGALSVVREALPRETIVAADAGGFRVWGLNTFAAYGPRRYVNPGSWATMGTGVPSAIGAAASNPDTPVVALTGDGGLMMCIHELHTAVAEELPIIVVVFNNDDYAIISEEAGRSYDLQPREYEWTDHPIDFVAVANGMGMDATRADSPDEIREALSNALASDRPSLIEVPVDPDEPQASEWMRE
ncbi:thiamine pyrophosphate-binding protein [Natronomonas halophila]|uniref:thiamine pyrophosphate-binding protein n=1 Tax=Natronomonas halophila TaxID=2747817 RepID=UPI0015B77E4F|nr:thiamine pyrophosphate-binding protein [Natronomonas halophila]QLD87086.1 thiamine pyrophosphate-binding protein [Natronomonas halophila]